MFHQTFKAIALAVLFYIFIGLYHIADLELPFSALKFDYRLSLGTKSPYIHPFEYQFLQNQTLKQVHLISRHGSRYWTRKKHAAMFTVADYLRTHVDRSRHPKIAHLEIPFPKDQAAELSPNGRLSMFGMGQRWARHYKRILDSVSIEAFSSSSTRAVDSMDAFLDGLGYPVKKFVVENRTLDADLNPELSCSKFGRLAEEHPSKQEGKLWASQYMAQTVTTMNSLLGIPLDQYQVTTILEICAAQISLLRYRRMEGLCYLLTDRDLENYEIFDDVQKYQGFSYGNEFNPRIACSLLTSLIRAMEQNQTLVTMRFTHAETLIPLITALGMFKDDHPISGKMTYDELKNRAFHSSHFSPFQGNIIFEVYDCPEGHCFRLFVNERPIVLPGCNYTHHLCPLSEFKRLLGSLDECNFDQMCENTHQTIGGWNQKL
jgi:multiple inositol-polyphosphate phosphatase/2,3-bisphosphoglycerate 3-phosphatase